MPEKKSERQEKAQASGSAKAKVKPGLWPWLQRNEKIILTAIIIGIFPTFGFGTVVISTLTGELSDSPAAIIDGEEVPANVYNEYLRRFLGPLQSFVRQMKDHQQWGGFFKRWENIGNEAVWKRICLLNEARKAGILVSEAEIRDYITDFFNFENKYSYQLFVGPGQGEESLRYYQTMFFFQGVYDRSEDGKTWIFDSKRYEAAVKGQMIPREEFEKTFVEDLMIRKLRYFWELPNLVSAADVYETYKKDREEVRLRFVRLDVESFKPPRTEPTAQELEVFYQGNRKKFEEPLKRSFEYIYADLARLEKLIEPSEAELKAWYDKNKDKMFREEEKKAEGAKEPPGGAGEPGKEPPKEPAKDPAKDPAKEPAKEAAAPAVKYKPLENEEVRAAARKAVVSEKAGMLLQEFMKEIYDRLRSIEARIRGQGTGSREELVASLKEGIVFTDVADNVNRNPDKWKMAAHPLFRIEARKSDGLLSKEEIRTKFGSLGLWLSDKLFEHEILATGEPLRMPEGFVIFRSIDEKFPSPPPLDSIREKVVEERYRQKQMEEARTKAADLRKKMQSSGFEAAAASEGLEARKTVLFTRKSVSIPGDGEHPPLGKVPAVIATAFALKDGEVSVPVNELDSGTVFLFEVAERRFPAPEEMTIDDFGKLRSDEERKFQDRMEDKFGTAWEEKHKVEDLIRDRSTHASGTR